MASYILPIYGRSGQIVICIDIAREVGGRGEGGFNGILAKPFEAPTFGTNRYLDDIVVQQQRQFSTLRLSTIGPLDLRDIQSPPLPSPLRGGPAMQITRSRHLPDTHNHQLSQLSSRPIEIEHEIEIEIRIGMEMEMEMQLEIAIRDLQS